MNRHEIAALLAYVDRLDPGRAPADRAAAGERLAQWSILLAHVPATAQHPAGPERSWDASQVAARHIGTSPYPIKPSDIGAPWEKYRSEIIGRHWDPAPAVNPDDEEAYRTALRTTRQAVAVGVLPPTPQHAIEGRPSPVRAVRDAEAARRLAALGSYVPRAAADALASQRPVRAERERLAREGHPDPLDVPCTWCKAETGEPCRDVRTNPQDNSTRARRRARPHPSRLDAATAHRHAQETSA